VDSVCLQRPAERAASIAGTAVNDDKERARTCWRGRSPSAQDPITTAPGPFPGFLHGLHSLRPRSVQSSAREVQWQWLLVHETCQKKVPFEPVIEFKLRDKDAIEQGPSLSARYCGTCPARKAPALRLVPA
jgi:hypothetical protein